MYIFIFEDGDVMKRKVVKENELQAADDGILDIIDIKEPSNPKQYSEGSWDELPEGGI